MSFFFFFPRPLLWMLKKSWKSEGAQRLPFLLDILMRIQSQLHSVQFSSCLGKLTPSITENNFLLIEFFQTCEGLFSVIPSKHSGSFLHFMSIIQVIGSSDNDAAYVLSHLDVQDHLSGGREPPLTTSTICFLAEIQTPNLLKKQNNKAKSSVSCPFLGQFDHFKKTCQRPHRKQEQRFCFVPYQLSFSGVHFDS